jgi:chorismate mutase
MKFTLLPVSILFLLLADSNAFIFPKSFNKLNFLRKNIDLVDDQIYYLLTVRYQMVKKIKNEKPTVYDKEREKEILSRLKNKNKLNDEFVKKLWRVIFMQSYEVQLRE